MTLGFRRTVASDLTFWLSLITTIFAVILGFFYYFYAATTITRELTEDARRTADEFSKILELPLFNFDQPATLRAVNIYLNSDKISGLRVDAEGVGEIFNNLSSVSSSLPVLSRKILKDDLLLGSMELIFDDSPVQEAKKRVIWTTLITIVIILVIYIISLRLILGRILVSPLTGVGSRLLEIAEGDFEGRIEQVPQRDLNTIVTAANRMSEELAARTRKIVESERNYREVFNATSDAIFIHDADDGSIVDVNQTMLEMYGYSRTEAIALSLGDLSADEEDRYGHQQAELMVRKALQEGAQVFQWQAMRKDGSLFWSEVALKKTMIGDHEVVLATVRDISERLRLEDNLRHSQKMEAIGTLAGGIAHDFNNILTAILGYAELAMLKLDPEAEAFVHLQKIDQASKRARDLVRQILTFSRKQHRKKELVHLSSIVAEAVALLRSSIPVTVEIRQNLSSQACVMVDPGQIHQVIVNLCTNGYQSMADASGTLTICLRDLDVDGNDPDSTLEQGRYVVIEVTDDGTGMDEATRSKIFEPYFTTKDTDKGTGLGLAVVHGIVQSHQGRITVTSAPGQGATFRVYLPVEDGVEEVELQSDAGINHSGDQKIMVVDDEESIRSLLKQMLSYGGYRVDVFADGAAAWEAFSSNPTGWDLIITDLTMPGLTGAELTHKVTQVRPDLPVILCTGYNELENGGRQEELAIRACLQKPVTMQELLSTTGRVLQADGKMRSEGT